MSPAGNRRHTSQPWAKWFSFIVLCGLGGYIAHPFIFPAQQEPAAVEAKKAELPIIYAEHRQKTTPEKNPALANIPAKLSETDTPEAPIEVPNDYAQPEASPFENCRLILVGAQADSSKARANDAKWLALAAKTGKWDAYRTLLTESLAEEGKKIRLASGNNRFDPVWKEPHYYQALLRWKTIDAFSEAALEATVYSQDSTKMVSWLMREDQAMEEILLTLAEHDDKKAVFEFLKQVWISHEKEPELAKNYFNLALACAVVFDQPLQSTNADSTSQYVNGLERYLWYVNNNEAGLTEGKVDRTSAHDLTFVVCSPCSIAELEWAMRKFRSLRRKNWGNTFSEVEYLMERAVEGFNPYDSYILEEILDKGGVCGDQSYFCVNTARAAGIPAFTLSGITDLGGHAWAAVKIDTDKWSTEIGRIGGVSNGQGTNPQGGPSISEQEIWLWSSKEHQSRPNIVRIHRLLWLSDFYHTIHEKMLRKDAVLVAHFIGKTFPNVWLRAYEILEQDERYTSKPESPESISLWSDFVKDLKRAFKDNPRMAALAITVEDKHLFPYAEVANLRRQLARDRRRTSRDANEQADLLTTSLKRESSLLLQRDKENGVREIGQLYDRALRDYGGSISGFRTMAEDYFSFTKDDEKAAKKAVQDIDLAFQRVVESGTKEWFRANAEIDLHRLICKLYREIGEDKRAQTMEKRLERELKKAKRGAL